MAAFDDLTTLNDLANETKREIAKGDKAQQDRDKRAHYFKAGAALLEAREKVEHGKWRAWLRHHGISQRRAYELWELAYREFVREIKTTRSNPWATFAAQAERWRRRLRSYLDSITATKRK